MSDKYVDAQRQGGEAARARESSGVEPKYRCITFETAVADVALDVRRLFTVGANEIPVRCLIFNDAIAGMTEVDLGLYRPNLGVVVDRDALMDGVDFAAGFAFASAKDGLAALGVEERGTRTFGEIASDVVSTDVVGHYPSDSYDIGLCLVSEVTAAGTVTVLLETIENQ